MPQVSKNRLSKQTEQELCDTLDFVVSKLGKKEVAQTFLASFLTPTERLMLAKRLAMIILLGEKISDTDIARTLNVTRVTVNRMQLFMEARGDGLRILFDILKQEKNAKELKSALLKLAAYAARAAGGRVKPKIF